MVVSGPPELSFPTTIASRNRGQPVTQRHWTTTRPLRAGLTAVVLAGGMLVGLTGPALAQVTTVETVPPEVDEDGRTAGDRIDRIVVTLRVLAGVVLVGTAAYWWQTRPANRPPRTTAGDLELEGEDREDRMPTIEPPDEVEEVTLLPAVGPVAESSESPEED